MHRTSSIFFLLGDESFRFRTGGVQALMKRSNLEYLSSGLDRLVVQRTNKFSSV
jgi:hypothetical protein